MVHKSNDPVGLNRIGAFRISRTRSSFDGVFDNSIPIAVENGMADTKYAQIGNIDEVYEIIDKKIENVNDFETKMELVFETVHEYFGTFDNFEERADHYPSEDEIYDDDSKRGKISDLKGKNAGMCVERAAVSQNILKHIGINSLYKTTQITNGEKTEGHAYNLIENEGKYYIFDSTMPREKDGKVTPIIVEIPEEVFEELSKPEEIEGAPVEVEYYNPIRKMDKHIIYDSWSKKPPYKEKKVQKIKEIEDEEER